MTHQYKERSGSPFSFGDGRDKITWVLASPLERIIAALINCVASALAFAPLGWTIYQNIFLKSKITMDELLNHLVDYAMKVLPTDMGKIGLVVFGVYLVLQMLMLMSSGQSLGKKIVGIKVITTKGEDTGFFHAVLLRKIVYNLIWITLIGMVLNALKLRDNFHALHLFWLPYFACLWMLGDEANNCRTLQDWLAGTAVVKKRPNVRQH